MDRDRPAIRDVARNPFRFGTAVSGREGVSSPVTDPVTPAGTRGREAAGALGAPVAVLPDADLAALTFIGLVEAPESAVRVAVLTDGLDVYHGRVDDVIAGRYRILAFDETSIEIERVRDGKSRVVTRSGI